MLRVIRTLCLIILGLLSLAITGCARIHTDQPATMLIKYLPEQDDSILNRHAPVFWVENYRTDHNRIGKVRAATQNELFVDPESPVIYAEKRNFTTDKGEYTNLIYRIHFQETPSGYSPYYLSAGKNVGLLIIVTLGQNNQPILFTTVHTCGCYLAFIPTSELPAQHRPKDWGDVRQDIYGENLPTHLEINTSAAGNPRVQIKVRSGTHRVMDVWFSAIDKLETPTSTIPIIPIEVLHKIPVGDSDQTTSFYETEGSRAGYVKNSYKTRERLFMSWWTLDWNIGQDKNLGNNKSDGPVFYTTLKPWQRGNSDMRDFESFLHYWGWRF